jgi:hypothetical protein
MPSCPMLPSSSPSSTDRRRGAALAIALAGALLGACGDDAGDTCGPGAAPADGITLTVGAEQVTYGGFSASVNNDCTISGSGVISVTVHGRQVGGTGVLTVCLPRPDLLGAGPVALSPGRTPPEAGDRVQLIDATATMAGGCAVSRDPAVPPAATATFTGYCDGGADPAGYALGFDGTISLQSTCAGGPTAVSATLAGTAAVVVQP